ncbi:MAG TPA: hypothetical protein VJS39_08820 [Gemmatimonadaceae bacterium]|nr:hypothetical protein [Gemmatimonadaceae bacterium]
MTATSWLKRFTTVIGMLLVVIAFVGCPPTVLRTPPQNKPAEITLPQVGSPQAFAQIITDLSEYGWGPARYAECNGCARAVNIRSTGLTHDIKAGNGPTKFRIVALVTNLSHQDILHSPSGTTFLAGTQYLLWVSKRNDNKATWGFIELGPGYTSTPQPIGTLHDCGHQSPPKDYYADDADFKDCKDLEYSGGVKAAYAAPPTAVLSISKPGWILCDPDCCTGTKTVAPQS